MLELYEKRMPVDILTLTSILKKKKQYSVIGGSEYLTSLANVVPTSSNIEHYARILKENQIRRSLIKIGAEVTDMAFDEQAETRRHQTNRPFAT